MENTEFEFYSNVSFVGDGIQQVSVVYHNHKYDTKTRLVELERYLKEKNNYKNLMVMSIITVENK